jgi:hypothetical protein
MSTDPVRPSDSAGKPARIGGVPDVEQVREASQAFGLHAVDPASAARYEAMRSRIREGLEAGRTQDAILDDLVGIETRRVGADEEQRSDLAGRAAADRAADIVVVAASGTTGAGRSAKVNLIGSEVMGSLSSYKFGGVHQHTPEIEEALAEVAGSEVKISFTPILAPMPRGILSTVTAKLITSATTESMHELYTKVYARDEFVTVLPLGQMPKTNSVIGSNHVHLQVAVDSHTNRLVVSAAIDNLGKGAAGQAIQNANLVCGFAENAGLEVLGLGV